MFARLKGADFVKTTILALMIALAWCIVERRVTAANWRTPIYAQTDALIVFAFEKAAAEGYWPLAFVKFNPHLGAPHRANWNDLPTNEDLLVAAGGLLTRCIGLFAAANFLALVAHVLAGVSFFVVCRILRYRWQWSFVGGIAFGLSHFAFQRGFAHLGVTYYGHIPLCLLVWGLCASRRGLDLRGKKFWLSIAIALITGALNVYYTHVFVQFLGFAAIVQAVRRQSWRKIVAPLLIGTVAVCGCVIMNLGTLYYQTFHSLNTEAASRTYQGVERYALKPLDLFMPRPDHRFPMARKIAWDYVHDEAKKVYVKGETFSQYLGLVGIGALLWLGIVALVRVCSWPIKPLPVQAIQVLWLILYSVVGGVNGFLGQLGLNLFRATNRYSIFILLLVLVYAVKQLSRLTRAWPSTRNTLAATFLAILILWDQLPPFVTQASIDRIQSVLSSDQAFTADLERVLPSEAMVFQLPAMKFPEAWPIAQMGDYDHFRPYLFSKNLRFSYGDEKGRGWDDWQFQVERLPPTEMIAALERYGFAAIYINRKGFTDGGAALVKGLEAAGRGRMFESRARDLVTVVLKPSAKPVMPLPWPSFKSGWYAEESNAKDNSWRYSSGSAELNLSNDSPVSRKMVLEFELASPSPRTVEIWDKSLLLYRSPMLNANRQAVRLTVDLTPNTVTLFFKTQPGVTFPGNRDTRLLGFVLSNLHITDAEGD